LNSDAVADCGMSAEELQDRELVHASGFFIWESHATFQNCASDEGPCLKEGKVGYIVIYIFGMVYMFVALAIICDEFFVASLECFTEEFEITPDVAGATFMAAGGSMPELFTSFVSTMRGKTEVGLATIVGSAVFNVLFVIAVCAVASKEPLELTWWPLARDSFFYIIALLTVFLFFGTISEGRIHFYEALILFAEYLLYCTFMKFNSRIQSFVMARLGSKKVYPVEGEESEPVEDEKTKKAVNLHNPSVFRSGIVQLLTQNTSIADTVGIAAVTQIRGSIRDAFNKLDKDGDGYLDEGEVVNTLSSMGASVKSQEELRSAVQGIARNRDGKISFENFEKWYIASEQRVEIEVRRVWDRLADENKGTINKDRISVVLKKLGHNTSDDELAKTVREIMLATRPPEESDCSPEKLDDTQAEINFDQFEAWYNKSLFWSDHHKVHCTEEEEAEGGFSIDPPGEDAGWTSWMWFVGTYPLCAMMYCTIPDVRNGRVGSSIRPEMAGCWKVAMVEFVLSLVWIAIFATCLYEWTVISSNTIGVPPEIAGLTLLAAGTSVPDLLSSYVVAKQGQGDMAVSSSLGSNLFDVTVGLPIPWLIYCAAHGGSVEVSTEALGVSIVLLMLMLAAVIVTVMICKWKMTKKMGYVMLILYILFLVQHLLRSFPRSSPVIPREWFG
jgi:K+-dependent Na+/Ca+ exchanger-like protein